MPIPDWNSIKASLAQDHARNMAATREHTALLRSQARWSPFGAVIWTARTLALLIVSIVIAFIFADWNAMRGPAERWASFKTGRVVHIDGNLDVHPWSWTPHIVVNGLRIGNPDWAGTNDMARIARVDMKVRLVPLFYGRLIFPMLDIESPQVSLVRDKQGRANWDFSADNQSASEPLKLPDINNLTVKNGKLEIVDKRRGLTFEGNVASNDAGDRAGFSLTGDGRLNGAIFNLDAHGGSLLHADPDKPYLFALKIRAGTTRVTADGSIIKPFDFGHLQANMTFKGNDLAKLYYLTGLALPNSPPYSIKGHLTRDDFVYKFQNFSGTVGNSDLEGNLTVDATTDRTLLTGAVASRQLDFDELGAIFGTRLPGAKVKRSVVQSAPKPSTTIDAVSATPTASNTATLLLPDAPLDVDRVRQMDARVTYQADSIKAQSDLALKSMYLGINLDHGVLTLDPLTIKFRQGKLTGRASVNAQRDVPVTDLDVRLTHLPLQQFFHLGSQDALEGVLAARAKLHGVGNSVHKAASTADGTVAFVVPHGQIRQAFAELMGIDVLNGLGLMLTKDKSQSDVRCAIASFRADNGVLHASQIVFDTDVVRAHGEGSVNLRNETLDLTLKGEPKKFRLFHLGAPITVQGPLSAPSVGVQASKALGQGGIAVALGALVAPVAALIPFVDPGLADDADCHGLIMEARRSGAPVSKAQAGAPN
ncbi:MAG TPA: AsmA family protein [Rhizomicrobium sp.]|jgi:hypothetical protein|nr:AsmA family protein [Rhizomicrobium sp.]